MRWRTGRRSTNVADRRGRGIAVGGGIGAVVLALVAMLLGVDPADVGLGGGEPASPASETAGIPPDDEQAQFVSTILGSTEDVWNELFTEAGASYREPTLVLFSDVAESACGYAQAAVGPFYCPVDEMVYIDLSFYHDLQQQLGASGDFAQAYVIAHEVGHHVQTLEGTTEQTTAARQRAGEVEANAILMRTELQADCYAGVWAYHSQQSQQWLEAGDIEEGLNAAAAIGDDRLQRQAQGYVVPDSFTHGSSEQRVRWFRRGLEGGDPSACDTLSAGQV
ncbi:MAG: KPN_02809 family neutral zinc metallopeptidase [Longimicrobiales bacterium]